MTVDAGGHAAGVVIQWLVGKARRTPPVIDPLTNAKVARYPRSTRAVAWILFGLCSAGAVVLTYKVPLEMRLATGIWTGVMALAMGAMLLDFGRVSLSWTESQVVFSSPWRGQRALRWEEFTGVKFSGTLGWFVFSSRDAVTIRPSMMLGGLTEFFAALKAYGRSSLHPEIDLALEQWASRAG